MSIRILSVAVTPNVVTVGQPISVTVSVDEVEWNNLKSDFSSWGEVKHSFANWNKVLNYIYTKPVADANSVRSADDYDLFDFDGNQVSIQGGYTSKHSAETISNFLAEVFNE